MSGLVITEEQLALKEEPIQIGAVMYVAKEMLTPAKARYDSTRARVLSNNGGQLRADGDVGELDPLIVELSLFEVYQKPNPDGSKTPAHRPVPRSVINTWRGAITEQVAEVCKRVNDIDQDETLQVLETRLELTQRKIDRMKAKQQLPKEQQPPEKN